jgi:hypothetical protein
MKKAASNHELLFLRCETRKSENPKVVPEGPPQQELQHTPSAPVENDTLYQSQPPHPGQSHVQPIIPNMQNQASYAPPPQYQAEYVQPVQHQNLQPVTYQAPRATQFAPNRPVYNQVQSRGQPQELCPAGGNHAIKKDFTFCGICWAALCFPWGLICCFMMQTPTCQKCGKQFEYE